jgi:acetoin utilization protein AcuB
MWMSWWLSHDSASSDMLGRPWQEQQIVEVMHRASIRVTPTTSVAAAAQLLVERGLSVLPVVEYEQVGAVQAPKQEAHEMKETKPILVGILSRSDLLLAFARSMGAYEPGMQLQIELPLGNMAPLAEMLHIATELHVSIRSILAAPLADNVPLSVTVRLGTINPTALLVRLQKAGIRYTIAPFTSITGGETHG